MEDTLRDAAAGHHWWESLAQTIDEHRRRADQRVEAQRGKLRELESRIATELDAAAQQLARTQEQTREAALGTEANATALKHAQAQLEERQQQLARQDAELTNRQTGCAEQLAQQRQQAEDFKRREAALAEARQAVDTQQDQLRQRQADAQHRENELKLKEQSLAEQTHRLQRQRRHIAQELRARKQQLTAEIDLHRAEVAAAGAGQDLQLQLKLSELQGKYDRLHEELQVQQQQRDHAGQRLSELQTHLETRQLELRHQQTALQQAQARQTEIEQERQRLQADLQKHLEEARRQAVAGHDDLAKHSAQAQHQAAEIARLTTELERIRHESQLELERVARKHEQGQHAQVQTLDREIDSLRQQLAAAQKAQGAVESEEVARLRRENRQLESRLADAQKHAAEAAAGGGGHEVDDLRRRFEMAVQDVRELKGKNAELSEQLSKARQSPAAAPSSIVLSQGWESLKQKLLADLETDFDQADEQQKADLLTVQGAIKITDEVVAEKEREIDELRRLLESQAQQVGEVAVGAAAVAQLLDTDELIRQERDSLKRLQDSLRDQLRQAEIDISMERAKLARERSEMDENLRLLEAERANFTPAGTSDSAADKNKKPGGRKWLARLGLGETNQE